VHTFRGQSDHLKKKKKETKPRIKSRYLDRGLSTKDVFAQRFGRIDLKNHMSTRLDVVEGVEEKLIECRV
jgi:hypothetical protein